MKVVECDTGVPLGPSSRSTSRKLSHFMVSSKRARGRKVWRVVAMLAHRWCSPLSRTHRAGELSRSASWADTSHKKVLLGCGGNRLGSRHRHHRHCVPHAAEPRGRVTVVGAGASQGERWRSEADEEVDGGLRKCTLLIINELAIDQFSLLKVNTITDSQVRCTAARLQGR